MSDLQMPGIAFVFVLVGGVLVVGGSLAAALMTSPAFGMHGAMPASAWWGWGGNAFAVWVAAWGLATGSVILLAAFRLRDPLKGPAWGVVAIVAGALSVLAMGGHGAGALAAIVGGALALSAPRAAPGAPRSEAR